MVYVGGTVRQCVARRFAGFWLVGASLLAPAPAPAQVQDRPNFVAARIVFDRLPARSRNEIFLELMATGDFTAMASSRFGTRLYDATLAFQTDHDLPPSGVLTPATVDALSTVGGGIFNSWRFEFLDHPSAPASIAIPTRMGLMRSATARGIALENRNQTLSIDFSAFAESQASLEQIFGNLTRPMAGRTIAWSVLRDDFFVVTGGGDSTLNYSRYIRVPGGIAGFTIAWNPAAYPNADRIAVVMANELYPRRMNEDAGGDLFASLPGDPPAAREATPLASESESSSEQSQQAAADARQREEAARAARAAAVAQQALDRAKQIAQQQQTARDARIAAEQIKRAAEQRLVADRLARVTAAAKAALADATGFVKTNRDDAGLLEHLQRIADLGSALPSGEPETIERKMAALTAGLAADPAYGAYAARQAIVRKREIAVDLQEAVRALEVQKRFLVESVTQDPTSPQAAALLGLVKQADAALAAPDLDRTQTLIGTIDAAVAEAGLGASFEVAKREAAKAAPAKPEIAGIDPGTTPIAGNPAPPPAVATP